MFPFNYFKTRNLIGLDIQEDEVQLLQLDIIKKAIYAKKIAFRSLANGLIINEKIMDPKFLKKIIQELVQETQTTHCHAAIALSGNSVITKRIHLVSSLTQKERINIITTNLDHYFPGVEEKLYFDFISTNHFDGNFQEIIIVAARQSHIDSYVNLINECGLQVDIVDIDSYALIRTLNKLFPQQQTFACLKIHSNQAQFFIFHQQEMIFFQRLLIANDKFLKEELSEQLTLAITLCLATYPFLKLETLIIMGKLSALPDIMTHLQKVCSLKVELTHPFAKLPKLNGVENETSLQVASRTLISCGLALRGFSKW